MLQPLAAVLYKLSEVADREAFVDATLRALADDLGIMGSFVLVADVPERRLFTLASRGYAVTGVGSDVPFGLGPYGLAAERRVPVRIQSFRRDLHYGRAVARHVEDANEIPLPQLAAVQSILAVPMVAGGALVGVLAAQSARINAFGPDEEAAFTIIAALLGERLKNNGADDDDDGAAAATTTTTPPPAAPSPTTPSASASASTLAVRHYVDDDSVFFGHTYIIKGVAGRILWHLLKAHHDSGRTAFSNKELRLEVGSTLPWAKDNLESRLILLRKRLDDKDSPIALRPSGRGRLELVVQRPLSLEEVGKPS